MKRILVGLVAVVAVAAGVLMVAAWRNMAAELRSSEFKADRYWAAFNNANQAALDFYNKLQIARARSAQFYSVADLPDGFNVAHDGDGFQYLDVDGIPLRFDAQQRCYVHNKYPDESAVGRVLLERDKNGAWTLQREKLYDGSQYRLTETGWVAAAQAFRR